MIFEKKGGGSKNINYFEERKNYECRAVHPNKINMAMLFWHHVESDASVHILTVAYTGQLSHVLQSRSIRPCLSNNPVKMNSYLTKT